MKPTRSTLWCVVLLGTALGASCAGRSPAKHEPNQQLDASGKMRLAQSLMKAGRVGEALAALDQAVAQEPNNPRLHQFYGETCLSGGLLVQAEREFRAALERDPYLTDAHVYLGAVYQELGRLSEAEAQYREALGNPAYPRPEAIYFGLGKLFARQGRHAEAEDELRKAVGIDPKFYAGHYELAGILEHEGELGEAVREYEVAEPGYRTDAEYQYRIGFAYFRQGERVRARERLARAVDLAPGSKVAEQAGEILRTLN